MAHIEFEDPSKRTDDRKRKHQQQKKKRRTKNVQKCIFNCLGYGFKSPNYRKRSFIDSLIYMRLNFVSFFFIFTFSVLFAINLSSAFSEMHFETFSPLKSNVFRFQKPIFRLIDRGNKQTFLPEKLFPISYQNIVYERVFVCASVQINNNNCSVVHIGH